MFRYIKGTIEMKLAQSVVVECGGVGFEMAVPQNSRLYLAPEGSEVTVFTYMSVREDDISLFGFDEEDGLLLFEKLITVNGIGAKAGISILSSFTLEQLRQAIAFEDAKSLQKANGIGKKSAERIVLELKDKFAMEGAADPEMAESAADAPAARSGRAEAVSALMALGYSRAEAMSALAAVPESDLTAEEYIKRALKNLF